MLALHFAPHPDDELIGAPATLMELRDAGWRIVNLACSLGRPDQLERRRAEVGDACDRAGFELRLPAEPIDISAAADPSRTRTALTAAAGEAIDALGPALVISPGPGDRHHGHRLVVEGVRDAMEARGDSGPPWWMWALWGALRQPTVGTRFGEDRLTEVLEALEAHRGELSRTDYRRVVRARAELSALLAPELLFGFGGNGRPEAPYAELLTAVSRHQGRWVLGKPHWLDSARPLEGSYDASAAVVWD